MFSTVKRWIHTKFCWIWSSDQSACNKFSFKSVENWNFAGPQKALKQAETNDVFNRSELLTSWDFKFFWIFKIGQLLLFKQLTSNLCNSDKFEVSHKNEVIELKIRVWLTMRHSFKFFFCHFGEFVHRKKFENFAFLSILSLLIWNKFA